MKTTLVTTAFFTLALSSIMGGPHDRHQHDDHAHDIGTKESFLNRLVIAPAGHGSASNLRAVENAAASANTVIMLGKVEYALGNSTLGPNSQHQLSEMLLQSGLALGPDTLIAVLGYADNTGPADANYHLSETRAELVRQYFEHLNAQHRIGLRTVSIAMGEEVELCEHRLGHNRVAEVWLIHLSRPGDQFVPTGAPIIEHSHHEPVVRQFAALPTYGQPVWSDGAQPAPSAPLAAADGHAHDGKCNHATEVAPTPETISMLQQLGFGMETVQNRIVGGVDVTALPVGSIIYENGKTFVLAKNAQNPPQFERWEVSLGQSDGRYVEAVTGVFPGDMILISPAVRR